jgi:hypothetical protein
LIPGRARLSVDRSGRRRYPLISRLYSLFLVILFRIYRSLTAACNAIIGRLHSSSQAHTEFPRPFRFRHTMSDQDGPLGGSGANDEELTLPKATVNKYVSGSYALLGGQTVF